MFGIIVKIVILNDFANNYNKRAVNTNAANFPIMKEIKIRGQKKI